MSKIIEVKVPDIGDFDSVDIIEVLVSPGDRVEAEDSLITLESDKASMEVPSPRAGTVKDVKVEAGGQAAEGTVILTLEVDEAVAGDSAASAEAEPGADEDAAEKAPEEANEKAPQEQRPQSKAETGQANDEPEDQGEGADIRADVVVLGSGPGGYSAAFRAADLGLDVVLVERYESLGGVCLNVGCIPSKALLHAAKVIDEARSFADHGITFGEPKIELDPLREWKDSVVHRLTSGLDGLAKRRKVQVVHGEGRFTQPHRLTVTRSSKNGDGDGDGDGENETQEIYFRHAIIAAGSRVVELPFIPTDDERIMDSTGALELAEVPQRLLVLGGGIIGLEMATVYEALGSKITVVELMDSLIPGCDKDLVKPLHKRIAKRYENIYLKTKVTAVEAKKKGIEVTFEGDDAPEKDTFDRVLVAVGRRPNGDLVEAELAGVEVNDRGFIPTDEQLRTNVNHIFAIGDITSQPMLAHKAIHEGKVAAEVIAGEASAFDARVIPSVAYTDPEVAWVGVTETRAKDEGIPYEKASFPWAASGRSLAMGRDEGSTKLLFDPETHRVIGGGVVGPNAGDLISEIALAIEMGSEAADIGLTVHPHPTLSETVAMSAEAFEGTLTDLYIPKRRKKAASSQ
ncbi:MAG: dihydrolipoyl dehydrogenase [Acidobacteriota bacterium]|nr:dihydrolipoyl dehydrogenase [Acidobacteriota bacterium]